MSTSSVTIDGAGGWRLLASSADGLTQERGLSAATVCCYGKQARKFLSWLPEPVDSAVRQLDSAQVTSFMVELLPGSEHLGSAKATVTAVRALLRFLHVTGQIRVSLAGAVPAVAGWRLASLPRGLDSAVVTASARELRPCHDRRSPGLRDPDVAGAVGVTRRRGRRPSPGRCRLAQRRDHHPRQGQPIGSASAAGRCR